MRGAVGWLKLKEEETKVALRQPPGEISTPFYYLIYTEVDRGLGDWTCAKCSLCVRIENACALLNSTFQTLHRLKLDYQCPEEI